MTKSMYAIPKVTIPTDINHSNIADVHRRHPTLSQPFQGSSNIQSSYTEEILRAASKRGRSSSVFFHRLDISENAEP